ncbi:MAG: aldehyde dehydrogenase family protein [Planctomycetota bacterium]|nr:aldehyde dehydrogenase family protein [Planctomycetota bacterium]
MGDSAEYLMYVDGGWRRAVSGATYDAIDPARGAPFGKVARGSRDDAQLAIHAANRARDTWGKVSLWERCDYARRVADIRDQHKEELADILCTELGKPRHGEAKMEADEASQPWRIAAEQAKYFEGHTKPAADPSKRVLTFWRPRGVVAALTPWNFPAAIPGEYLPFAMVMGNTVVWSPAPTAAATACKLMECIHEAGVPAGVVNLVLGPGNEVGDELVASRDTHAVGMTGSPQTAQVIASRAGVKPCLFELGGNGPIIVFPDVDPAEIAASIGFACFFAAGQVCSSGGRILVAERLQRDLTDALVEESKRWIHGDPWDPNVVMGPQNNLQSVNKVAAHVADAVTKGARIAVGGHRPDHPGFFYEPTVLENYTLDSLINREETFGPVAPITSFSNEDEAWRYVNACDLGLVSAIFTRDVERAWRWAEQLNTGMTIVNDWTHFWEHHLPFGGLASNRSGIGRIGGRHTLEFMSDLKIIVFNVGRPSEGLPPMAGR